jgi:hypothetical protein
MSNVKGQSSNEIQISKFKWQEFVRHLDFGIHLIFGRHVPRPLGRDQGAQYKRKLPYREAVSFKFAIWH